MKHRATDSDAEEAAQQWIIRHREHGLDHTPDTRTFDQILRGEE